MTVKELLLELLDKDCRLTDTISIVFPDTGASNDGFTPNDSQKISYIERELDHISIYGEY